MTRYDSLNIVDEQSLNNSFSNAINNINNKANPNLNYKNFNYKQSLIKLFNNKKNIINANNQYENFLKNKSNYQKNNLWISFPMNYNDVYFSWWGFSDYFYLYLSSSVTHEITRFINSAGYTAILKILEKYDFFIKWAISVFQFWIGVIHFFLIFLITK